MDRERFLGNSGDTNSDVLRRLDGWIEKIEEKTEYGERDQADRDACLKWIRQIAFAEELQGVSQNESPATRFSEIRWVASGAHGMVFRALDGARGNRNVAIKLLRPSLISNKVVRRRMESEAKLVAELQHPGILEVLEAGVVDQLPYLVTEFADGGSLADAMAGKVAGWNPRQAAWMGLKVAEALWAAHSKLILHRDIKPGNILLRKADDPVTEGIGLEPLLCDFGLALPFGDPNATALTTQGKVLGTVAYMSPEQVLGESLQPQSDQFSLGVVLHELVYGVHPFRDASQYGTLKRIVSEEPIQEIRHAKRIPKPLQRVIEKCLAKNPSDRYRTMSQLVDDLQCYLDGKPISIPAPTPWRTLQRLAVLHPIGATFLATLLASLLAMVFLLNREWTIQKKLTKQAEELAEARAKISSLFLDSMRRTNSGMNDTILSGQRVLPDMLLLSLESQLPLLEEASVLEPNDIELLNHLEVLLHYCSLCYYHRASNAIQGESKQPAERAIEMRGRSLNILDKLLIQQPRNRFYLRDRINNEFLMSLCYKSIPDVDPAYQWTLKGLGHVEEYLVVYPNDRAMRETENGLRIAAAEAIQQSDPEKSYQLLELASRSSLALYEEDQSNVGHLVYAVNALHGMAKAHSRSGDYVQMKKCFQQAEGALRHGLVANPESWILRENLHNHFLWRSSVLYQDNELKSVVDQTVKWAEFLRSIPEWKDLNPVVGTRQSTATHYLAMEYVEWLALAKLHGSESPQANDCRKRADEWMLACCKDPKVNLDLFKDGVSLFGIPVEILESWIAEARSAKGP
ncbi:MAG: serine/threonine protein kinase [Pirellulaceae bacterium]